MILTRKLVTRANVDDFTHVAVRLRPYDFVAPRLVDASHPETVYAIRPRMATVRLQKVLAHAGVASRRAAERLISAGRVRVDGQIVTELGSKVDPRDSRVEVDGLRIVRESPVYVILHKPRGVVSTMHDPEGRPSVRELLAAVPGRVYPVGRLDFNTSGVLLATNDGQFAETLLHPRRAAPKTYVVKLQGVMEPNEVDRWRRGVELEDGMTLPAKVKLLRHEADKTWLELTITEGRNLQVRRMGDATGFRVMRLARTSFAGVDSEGVAPGHWRYLTADELTALKKQYGVPKRVVSQGAAPPPVRPKAPERPRERPGRSGERAGRAGERPGRPERAGRPGERPGERAGRAGERPGRPERTGRPGEHAGRAGERPGRPERAGRPGEHAGRAGERPGRPERAGQPGERPGRIGPAGERRPSNSRRARPAAPPPRGR
jgi:23S rRNA pseudouridine2605 synthase